MRAMKTIGLVLLAALLSGCAVSSGSPWGSGGSPASYCIHVDWSGNVTNNCHEGGRGVIVRAMVGCIGIPEDQWSNVIYTHGDYYDEDAHFGMAPSEWGGFLRRWDQILRLNPGQSRKYFAFDYCPVSAGGKKVLVAACTGFYHFPVWDFPKTPRPSASAFHCVKWR